jgi:hypothetical protein
MNECPLFQWEMTADYREIFPSRAVPDKLLNQRFPIWPGFCKEQNPRRVTVDPMYDKGLLPPRFEFCREKRQGRWKVGVIRRHRQHFGRLIEDDDGIVLVKHPKLPSILLS